MTIVVGTCGFSYRDWIGPFYPLGIKPADMLPYYAERFPAVEIDSTYYAIPKPQLFERMVARTPRSFTFTVKAPGSVTHVPADGEPMRSEIEAFSDCLVPLVSAGRLGALLAQFPHSFRPGEDAYHRLELLAEHWSFAPIVCEFRHRDWQNGDQFVRLRDLGLGWCNVDEPTFSTLMRPSAEASSEIGYIRFHGRNYEKWWRQERASHERYSYDYSEPEMERWLPRIGEVAEKTEKTYVFFNNHHLGKAAANALEMRRMLAPLTGDIAPPPVGEQAQTKLF